MSPPGARSNEPSTRPSTCASTAPASRPGMAAAAPECCPQCSPFTGPEAPGLARISRSSSIALCDEHQLPRPEVNVYVEGHECDFVWRDQRLIVETDGGAAHGTRRARERDPLRDGDLMIAGWRVWRLTYERLLTEPTRSRSS